MSDLGTTYYNRKEIVFAKDLYIICIRFTNADKIKAVEMKIRKYI
jgi:hypothetical protein